MKIPGIEQLLILLLSSIISSVDEGISSLAESSIISSSILLLLLLLSSIISSVDEGISSSVERGIFRFF
jgi:choline-glycine betaine transporter